MSRFKALVVGLLTSALIASGAGVAHASLGGGVPTTCEEGDPNPLCDITYSEEVPYPWKCFRRPWEC